MPEIALPPEPDRFDPIAILREEAYAAAVAHGADRCEELANNLVARYVSRIGGFTAYVPTRRAQDRARVASEIYSRFNGTNFNELARDFHMSARNIRYIIARMQSVQK